MKYYLTTILTLVITYTTFSADFTATGTLASVSQTSTGGNARSWGSFGAGYINSLAMLSNSEYTEELTYRFTFPTIPNNATITGVTVTITRRGMSIIGVLSNLSLRDLNVSLNLGGANKKTNTSYGKTDETITYGSSTDDWGTTLNPSMFNSGTFGVIYSVHRNANGGATDQYAILSEITAVVAYSVILPVEMLSFHGHFQTTDKALIYWSTATEINSNKFVLERSLNGTDYVPVEEFAAAGQSNTIKEYSFLDRVVEQDDPIYYRLRQVDFDGSYHIFGPIALRRVMNDVITLFPNPSVDKLFIEFPKDKLVRSWQIFDLNGKLLTESSSTYPVIFYEVDVRHFQEGSYILKTNFYDGSINSKRFMKR